ncbi:MAG: UDP-N-acetylglucosamine 4,6-dehydratase, partial [uncultured bacterium]
DKVLLISTDKAAQPVNLYGSTKLCAEKLFISGNSYGAGKTKFSCVRYGNVIGSRGSIVETLLGNKDKGDKKVYITDERMTRFWITISQAFDLVNYALETMEGGEMFIPKVPSMKLTDLFDAIVPGIERQIVGLRPGEKIHEVLLTEEESRHAFDLGKYFVVLPQFIEKQEFAKYTGMGKEIAHEYRFVSDTNEQWITAEEFCSIIEQHEI